eukprot:6110335-Prorocentrum_lima.AAC.1
MSDNTGVAGAVERNGGAEVLGASPVPSAPGYTVEDLVAELDEIRQDPAARADGDRAEGEVDEP